MDKNPLLNASNFSSQCLVLDEIQTSNSFKLYSWSNFELTWTQETKLRTYVEPEMSRTQAQFWKSLVNNNRFVYQNRSTIQKKTHSNPPKNPNLQTESSTQHLNSELKSQHSLGSMNRKWNLTWQHKTLLGIWKICALVSLL